MAAKLTDRISGVEYTLSRRFARAVGESHLYISQIAPGVWRYVNWDLIGDSASVTGEIYSTLKDAMRNAERFAKEYGFKADEIEMCSKF